MRDEPVKPGKPARWWQDDKGDFNGLPNWVVTRLLDAGLDTAQKIRDAGADELLRMPNFGKKALVYVKDWLRSLDDEDSQERQPGKTGKSET